MHWSRGIAGLGPIDRCASAGSFSATLRSDPVGTYAPDHALCHAGWALGTKVRLTLSDGTDTRVAFIGRVREVTPGVGPHASGARVAFTATDWLDDAAMLAVEGVAPQIDQRGDQILGALIDSAAVAPESEDYDTGDSTFPFALDNIADGRTRLLQALAQVAMSEFGYVYLTGPGALTFEKRTARQTNTAPGVILDNTLTGLNVRHARGVRPTLVRVTAYPRIVDAAATTVLFKRYDISANQDPLTLAAAATVTVFGPYGDPANGNERCGGTAMVTPAATTDYLANAAADGTGTNKTAQLGVVATFTANGVSMALTNNDAGTIYVTLLQCRGKGVYNRDAVTVESGSGDDLVSVDMPFEGDVNTAAAVAASIIDLWSDATPCAATFTAQTAARLTAAIMLDVGGRVWVDEDASGTTVESYIQSVAQTLLPGPILQTTWGLIPANEATYWILDDATYGPLGVETRLGF
jgi:hypothetical protein